MVTQSLRREVEALLLQALGEQESFDHSAWEAATAAYTGIASAWIGGLILGSYLWQKPRGLPALRPKRAVELDPDLPDGHVALADLPWLDWNWKAGENEYLRAIELDPNFVDARNDYSYFLIIQGRLSRKSNVPPPSIRSVPAFMSRLAWRCLALAGLRTPSGTTS